MIEYIIYDHAMEDCTAIKNCATDLYLLIWKDVYDISKGKKACYKIICATCNHTFFFYKTVEWLIVSKALP